MPKVWQGPTPYDKPHMSREAHLFARGYRAAFNSPEVRAMYEALRSDEAASKLQIFQALGAYEAGLKENDDGNQ